MLLFLLEAGCIELDEEVAGFYKRAFLNDLDHGECAVTGPGEAADFDVFATLNFTLVENLRDKISLFRG